MYEYAVQDLLTKRDTIPKLVEERLAAVGEKIHKLEERKPAPPAPKVEVATDTTRLSTPPVLRLRIP